MILFFKVENSVEKSDTLQNLDRSSLSLEMDRENDDVYLYTTRVSLFFLNNKKHPFPAYTI